jgi:hypothetical protein
MLLKILKYLGWVICPICNEGYDPTNGKHVCSL